MDTFEQEFNGLAIMDSIDANFQQITQALDPLPHLMSSFVAIAAHKEKSQTSINETVLQITALDSEFDGDHSNVRYLDPAYLSKIASLDEKLKEDNEKLEAQNLIAKTKVNSKKNLSEDIVRLRSELKEATARKEREEKEEQERIDQLALQNQQNQLAPEVFSVHQELTSPELPLPVQPPRPQQKKKRTVKKKQTDIEIPTSSSEVQPQQVLPKLKEPPKSKKKVTQVEQTDVLQAPQPVVETYIATDIRMRLLAPATVTYPDSTTPELPKEKSQTRVYKGKAANIEQFDPIPGPSHIMSPQQPKKSKMPRKRQAKTKQINSPEPPIPLQSATPVAPKKKAPRGKKTTKSTATGSNSSRRSITPLEIPELVQSPINPKLAAKPINSPEPSEPVRAVKFELALDDNEQAPSTGHRRKPDGVRTRLATGCKLKKKKPYSPN